MKKLLITALSTALVLGSCNSTKKVASDVKDAASEAGQEMAKEEDTETVELDPLEVLAAMDPGPYRESHKRVNDLISTSLKLKFDYAKRHVMGQATLELTPYFYPTSILTLDAKGFKLNEVALMEGSTKKPLDYEYDDWILTINLPREYKQGEQYKIFIDYVGAPDDLPEGGSVAITGEKGLYFINPDGKPDKPIQIWTQGETEYNSCWFPTIDKPNEKSKQEIFVTVEDKYKTLSNGVFLGSNSNGDGTRTDHWKQDIPHAPYLFALIVGEFAVVKDTWNGKVVDYYVEEEYEQYARQIFPNTPEMIQFYSDLLDYEFPWDKYSQIIVRDYVSGAMENSSAVIFGEFMQGDDRDLLDFDGEDIVAHELFHHWFGDIVTCESWSNLPLNESFATYGEYLWLEHKYGSDEADNHLRRDLANYLADAENNGKKDLIRFHYDEKEDMFDGHSYQKGGRILHMLRHYVGDEAFFKSLNKYLVDNEYTAVEIHNLRLAFEEVTGEDLNWFFNQWFLNSGHPILEITKNIDEELGKVNVNIKQTQPEDVFELPIAIDMYFDDEIVKEGVKRENVIMTEREQSFSFDVDAAPEFINVDGDKILLCEKVEKKPTEEWVTQYAKAPLYLDKYEVLQGLKDKQSDAVAQSVMLKALEDDFWAIRSRAALNMDLSIDAMKNKALPILKKMALEDKEAACRADALGVLAELEDSSLKDVFVKGMKDKSYSAMGNALSGLAKTDSDLGMKEAAKLEDNKKGSVQRSISNIYGEMGGKEQLGFFEKGLKDGNNFTLYTYQQDYGKILQRIDDANSLKKGINSLKANAADFDGDGPWWVRLSAMQALGGIKGSLLEKVDEGTTGLDETMDLLNSAIDEIKAGEEHPRLKMIYQMMQ